MSDEKAQANPEIDPELKDTKLAAQLVTLVRSGMFGQDVARLAVRTALIDRRQRALDVFLDELIQHHTPLDVGTTRFYSQADIEDALYVARMLP